MGLGQRQLRGVLLVDLEYDVAQANARFVGQAVGGNLQGPQGCRLDVDADTENVSESEIVAAPFTFSR